MREISSFSPRASAAGYIKQFPIQQTKDSYPLSILNKGFLLRDGKFYLPDGTPVSRERMRVWTEMEGPRFRKFLSISPAFREALAPGVLPDDKMLGIIALAATIDLDQPSGTAEDNAPTQDRQIWNAQSDGIINARDLENALDPNKRQVFELCVKSLYDFIYGRGWQHGSPTS